MRRRLAGLACALATTTAGAALALVATAAPAYAVGPTTCAAATSGAATYTDWANDFERAIAVPTGGNNDVVIIAWMKAEGGGVGPAHTNVATFNPLNTTLNEPGSYSINNLGGGHGVQAYRSWPLGVLANCTALLAGANGGSYGYGAIWSDLAANAPVATTAAAIGASSWCSPNACYGGPGAPTIVGLANGPAAPISGAPSTAGTCNIITYSDQEVYPSGSAQWTAGYSYSCNLAAATVTSDSGSGHLYLATSGGGRRYQISSGNYDCGNPNVWPLSSNSQYAPNVHPLRPCTAGVVNGDHRIQGMVWMGGTGTGAPLDTAYDSVSARYGAGPGGYDLGLNYTTETATKTQHGPMTYPPYPAAYYPGGTPGGPGLSAPPGPPVVTTGATTGPGGQPLPAGSPTCSRVMPQAQTSPVSFQGALAARQAGVTYSYSWNFGDGTGTSVEVNPSYTYTGTPPANGWTATVTVTATGDGATYLGTTTGTCALRVDFANPDQSTAGTSGGGSGTDSSSCPSGWGWLNPAALVAIIPCLFVPSSTTISNVTGLYTTMKTTEPFSFAIDVASFLPGAVSEIQAGMGAAGTATEPCLARGSRGGASGNIKHDPLQGNQLCLTSAATATGLPLQGIRLMILFMVITSFAFGIWRLIGRTIG